ncbi:MAG: response regulator [Deltaproteobacteria bacterium]|nr:response regulator [Deltaproteobacteria bacterium]
MKGIFPNRLSSKMIVAVVFSILISFLITGLTVYFVSARIIRARVVSDLRLQSRIIGSNCSAALLFNDNKAARDILNSFKSLKEIESAVLFDSQGKEFAYYIKEGSIFVPFTGEVLDSDDFIAVSEKIEMDNETVGKIIVVSNMSRIESQMRFVTHGVATGVVISIVIALLLVLFFTRVIFSPVKNLITTMQTVSENKDYSVRADVVSEDEFGSIAKVFNEMLMQIQMRERELNKYREHLEEEVRKRTQELELLNKRLEKELIEVKKMEEIISRSAAEWRTTFDSINDAVFMLDEKGNVLRCNKTAIDILGKNFGEINGKYICDVAHGKSDEECGLSNAIREKSRISKVLHSGEKVFQVYYDPILSDGRLLGFVHIMSDITEKHNLDENIRQIQKMEAVGRLAGGIAHDFNNLLSIMTLYTGSLLKRLKDDTRAQNELQEIKKVIERATSLSRQLLAFSRKQILNPEVFDVNESLRANYKMLSRLIGENIKIEMNLVDYPLRIFADRSQFDNVIMNMVINSRDAMPDGGLITIKTEFRKVEKEEIPVMDADNRDFLVIRISDNGQGMSEEIKKKIFEPFFTTKPKGKGTGLGLAMVYGFVRQCNGYIDVKSKEGEGTMFTLYFPPAAEETEVKRPKSGLIRGFEDLRLNILLVEDDDDVRRSIVKMLEDNKFRIRETSRAKNALDLILNGNEKYDLIITDIVMPEMNGIEFFRKIREFDPQIPVILITGYSDDFLPQEDISRYRDIIIQKPFNESQLIGKIREIMSAGR